VTLESPDKDLLRSVLLAVENQRPKVSLLRPGCSRCLTRSLHLACAAPMGGAAEPLDCGPSLGMGGHDLLLTHPSKPSGSAVARHRQTQCAGTHCCTEVKRPTHPHRAVVHPVSGLPIASGRRVGVVGSSIVRVDTDEAVEVREPLGAAVKAVPTELVPAMGTRRAMGPVPTVPSVKGVIAPPMELVRVLKEAR
jgi:hypothetical protein